MKRATILLTMILLLSCLLPVGGYYLVLAAQLQDSAAAVQQFLVTFSFAVCAALWVPLVLGHAWKYAAVSALCLILTALSWQISMRCRPRALQQAGVSEQLF